MTHEPNKVGKATTLETIVTIQKATLTREEHRTARLSQVHYGRTRMIVFPLIRVVGLKAVTALSRVET